VWLATTTGLVLIVKYPDGGFLVKARQRGLLERMTAPMEAPHLTVVERDDWDYPFCCKMSRSELARFVHIAAMDVDYPSFATAITNQVRPIYKQASRSFEHLGNGMASALRRKAIHYKPLAIAPPTEPDKEADNE